mmetsp:Transcript_40780/g.105505  ORF Transcript_40780/g.105505 Transcript_40780/m.105505 type:complete len:220 (-) Transcript_40780:226-885(-)
MCRLISSSRCCSRPPRCRWRSRARAPESEICPPRPFRLRLTRRRPSPTRMAFSAASSTPSMLCSRSASSAGHLRARTRSSALVQRSPKQLNSRRLGKPAAPFSVLLYTSISSVSSTELLRDRLSASPTTSASGRAALVGQMPRNQSLSNSCGEKADPHSQRTRSLSSAAGSMARSTAPTPPGVSPEPPGPSDSNARAPTSLGTAWPSGRTSSRHMSSVT